MHDRVALILEDEGLIAMDIGDALASKGFFVATAVSSEAARRWLADNPPPDVAIIDVTLADGPSHKLAAFLTELGVPLVVHSSIPGPVMPDDEAFAKAVWINKPSYADDILAAVEKAVSKGPLGPEPIRRP